MQSPRILSLCIALALLSLTMVHHAAANPTNLAAGANIYMFPKPYKLGDLVLKSAAGRIVSLKEFRGKVVLLHFWSINCPACRMEEPLLQQVKRTFGNAGFEVLAVNLVDPPNAVASHVQAHRPPFPVLFDGGHGFDLQVVSMGGKKTAFVVNPQKEAILEVPGFPTTYIIDANGNAVGYSVGPARWNNSAALMLIQNLIRQRSTSGVRGMPAAAERYSMR